MSNKTEREGFEKFMSERMMLTPLELEFQPKRNCYKEYRTHFAWTAWRQRAYIATCDCDHPSQCWEPCGELGHDERYVRASEMGIMKCNTCGAPVAVLAGFNGIAFCNDHCRLEV